MLWPVLKTLFRCEREREGGREGERERVQEL
jgi:hypothetical protein